PRLSWKLSAEADARNVRQSAYQIVVAADPGGERDVIWDTGKVQSGQSVHVRYAGPPLRSGQRCYWRVRVWDQDDRPSEWSAPAWWEMGLLDAADWQAQWITLDWDDGQDSTQPRPAPMLRRAFTLDGRVRTARLYVTSLGLYELRLNGRRVGDALLTPGWTSYNKRLQYQTYDVTELLGEGANAIGAMLADGWYRGHIGFDGQRRNLYGSRLALLAQLHVTYDDGREVIITSDADWRATTGPIRMAEIYHGETYDARLEQPGWDCPDFDDRSWAAVRILDHRKDHLIAQVGPLVRRQEALRPVRIFRSPKGECIADFGQNMVGWVRLRVRGAPGTTVTLRHAEVLDRDGNFYTENLRAARQTLEYTLKGEGEECYEPRFTFMGFRYVKVEGWPGEPTADDLTGVVVHSDIPPIGDFNCSNPLINQLQHNIVWGQKGNFVDVPTDCPQRDERMGWTGDAQVFARTACFNRHVAAFFTKWLGDLAADQLADGNVPYVIPNVLGEHAAGSAAWGDAAVIVPWTVYLCYGDKGILEAQYESMAGWVDYMRRQAGERFVWASGFHFGDWLDYRGSNPLLPAPVTNSELIATAFFAHGADLMRRVARVLGKEDDARMYDELFAKARAAFNAEFVTPNGRVGPGTQTAYVLALHFDLLPERLRPTAAQRLADAIRKADYHLTTGFVGTPYVCHVLSRFGYTDLAYELLNQESYPSWLYPVKRGATTIWERWDGIKPDGSFQDPSMNSFNHYAYGAIGEWLYRVVAGIEVDEDAAGYAHALIQPQPGGGLKHARATLETPYGRLAVAWELTEADFRLQVTVPPNARATIRIPSATLPQVTESGQPLRAGRTPGVRTARTKGDAVVVEVGSGRYSFVSTGLNLAQAMANVRHVAGRRDRACALRELLADERARAVLVKHLGEEATTQLPRLQSPDLSLEAAARRAPHLITPEQLKAIEQELLAL
ncbi:MAG: glycoside hydrolase family 78 protein, partial [Thermoflexales bacterium]|nr:glycoside hydrolase family 78 protein [Thermoflexales bacterium]